ncbi:MAG: hypothetical protein HQK54_05850 [Oligoflexales bacterium]|nr:hypothetical protein [Oligoflexales bacterium]
MLCKRCPHLVRHGQADPETKNIEFRNICGLMIKTRKQEEIKLDVNIKINGKKPPKKLVEQDTHPQISAQICCSNYPFPKIFDYIECETYQSTFKSTTRKNDVIPTKDFQYSDVFNSSSITDMELL